MPRSLRLSGTLRSLALPLLLGALFLTGLVLALDPWGPDETAAAPPARLESTSVPPSDSGESSGPSPEAVPKSFVADEPLERSPRRKSDLRPSEPPGPFEDVAKSSEDGQVVVDPRVEGSETEGRLFVQVVRMEGDPETRPLKLEVVEARSGTSIATRRFLTFDEEIELAPGEYEVRVDTLPVVACGNQALDLTPPRVIAPVRAKIWIEQGSRSTLEIPIRIAGRIALERANAPDGWGPVFEAVSRQRSAIWAKARGENVSVPETPRMVVDTVGSEERTELLFLGMIFAVPFPLLQPGASDLAWTPLSPGLHDLVLVLEDGERVLQRVTVRSDEVTTVVLPPLLDAETR